MWGGTTQSSILQYFLFTDTPHYSYETHVWSVLGVSAEQYSDYESCQQDRGGEIWGNNYLNSNKTYVGTYHNKVVKCAEVHPCTKAIYRSYLKERRLCQRESEELFRRGFGPGHCWNLSDTCMHVNITVLTSVTSKNVCVKSMWFNLYVRSTYHDQQQPDPMYFGANCTISLLHHFLSHHNLVKSTSNCTLTTVPARTRTAMSCNIWHGPDLTKTPSW